MPRSLLPFLLFAAAPTARAAPSDDNAIAYSRVGQGPAVVLIHGLGGDRSVWKEEIARLQSRHTVVALDLPGHGASPVPRFVSLDNVARQIARLLRREHLAPATLVGHSLGGTIAARVPLVDRGAARAVVVIDAPIGQFPFSRGLRDDLRAQLKGDQAAGLRNFWKDITKDAAQLERVVASARKVPLSTFMAYIDDASEHGASAPASTLGVPMLLLACPLLLDETPAHRLQQLAKAGFGDVARLTVETFPTSRHWLFWDDPQHFHAALDAFLAKVETGDKPAK